jgi:putative redox protein
MKATVKLVENVKFSAQASSGHSVIMDGAPESGGQNQGSRPMELILMGLGGCTSFDVINILRKSRQQVTDCVAELSAERAETVPSVFTSIHIHFVVTGIALKESQVKRAISLSAEKYCSASLMLERGGVVITHDFEIIEQ